MKQPRYVVRLAEHFSEESRLLLGQTLFYVPERASFIFTRSLLNSKGSDASNVYDEEVDDDVLPP